MDDTPWEDGAYIDAQLSSITGTDNGRASVKEWLFRERLGWSTLADFAQDRFAQDRRNYRMEWKNAMEGKKEW